MQQVKRSRRLCAAEQHIGYLDRQAKSFLLNVDIHKLDPFVILLASITILPEGYYLD